MKKNLIISNPVGIGEGEEDFFNLVQDVEGDLLEDSSQEVFEEGVVLSSGSQEGEEDDLITEEEEDIEGGINKYSEKHEFEVRQICVLSIFFSCIKICLISG